MLSRTGIILGIFLGLLLVQTACAAGRLPHCDHPPEPSHGQEHCPDDHCRDDFPVPAKVLCANLLPTGVVAAAPGRPLAADRAPDRPLPAGVPAVSPVARPCGSFPLLI